MKRNLVLYLILIFVSTSGYPQADSLQKQIDAQVWKPFIKSFNELDTKGFMAVHSSDMTRVIQDGNAIFGYEQYYLQNEQGNQQTEKSNRKRTLELRFSQRIAGNDRAFEIGYYKFTSFQPDGTSRKGYGKFHVLLRKESGVWKILMDADASENTTEAIFLSGKPIE